MIGRFVRGGTIPPAPFDADETVRGRLRSGLQGYGNEHPVNRVRDRLTGFDL
jgi:hypothetical protein